MTAPNARPVWVDLRVLFRPTGATPPLSEQGGRLVRLDREVRGELHGWQRGSRGHWLCVCSYEVEHADGRAQRFERQLLPYDAVRLRDR